MWPDLDAYDLHVEVGAGAGQQVFRIDLKDYSNPMLLARKAVMRLLLVSGSGCVLAEGSGG